MVQIENGEAELPLLKGQFPVGKGLSGADILGTQALAAVDALEAAGAVFQIIQPGQGQANLLLRW